MSTGNERQSRPEANRAAKDVSDDTGTITLTDPQALAHGHAVLVSTPSGRWSRRLYLSLHSADKAMQRAQDRGQVAHCVLVELVPVPGAAPVVVGGDDR